VAGWVAAERVAEEREEGQGKEAAAQGAWAWMEWGAAVAAWGEVGAAAGWGLEEAGEDEAPAGVGVGAVVAAGAGAMSAAGEGVAPEALGPAEGAAREATPPPILSGLLHRYWRTAQPPDSCSPVCPLA
jgi:hypothetical protein